LNLSSNRTNGSIDATVDEKKAKMLKRSALSDISIKNSKYVRGVDRDKDLAE